MTNSTPNRGHRQRLDPSQRTAIYTIRLPASVAAALRGEPARVRTVLTEIAASIESDRARATVMYNKFVNNSTQAKPV